MTIEIILQPDDGRYTLRVDGIILAHGMRLEDAYRAAWALARTSTAPTHIVLPPLTATYPSLYVD
jgi:hypothetical protein